MIARRIRPAPPTALVWIAAFVFATSARADVVTLTATCDNTLFQDAQGDTSNGQGPAFFAGQNGQNLTRRGLVAFDVAASLPPGIVVEDVRLDLTVSSAPDATPRAFVLHRALAAWGEGSSSSSGGGGAPAMPGDATWLHTFYPDSWWSAPGGDFELSASAFQTVGDVGLYSWSGPGLVADVQAWADGGGDFGWLLQGEETSTRSVRRFDSRESPDLTARPTLTITFSYSVPARASTWGALKSRFRRGEP